ncbi:hypothetical protein JMN32_05620 [Fulvivirga sp. 29W222]|uniref:Uncharacterized protein n=1 Tax=Fulvivirga marina TaxID=2494733 RepID=A0A937FWQ9_9BACT|nr:hypothetical protein [Fulvivirga marina]MBL6445776.1 hypothetical protein [Fulvivirga marina]
MIRYLLLSLLFTILICCNREAQNTESTSEDLLSDTVITDTSRLETIEEPVVKTDYDRFNEALVLLDAEFGYQSQVVNGDTLYDLNDRVAPGLAQLFTSCADQDPRLNKIDFTLIKGVKKTLVKSKETIDHMYLKVDILEWEFESDSVAAAFTTYLTDIAMDDRECINKGGILWWRIENKMYLMTTPAFRFFFEFDKIKSVLDQKLKPV